MAEHVKGRFAPSPTGRMHAGNVFAALMAWLIAKAQGGDIVLRIEDLDEERSKPEWTEQILRDFEALGLTWDEGPYFQSTRKEAYREAFEMLVREAEVYPCFCTRADLHAASAPHRGEKLVYPGTCRHLSAAEAAQRRNGRTPAWRLAVPDEERSLTDLAQGRFAQNLARDCGDFIVRRSDGLFAYQLAVVVDDADQGVTSVVRGMDLLVSTPQQMYLQDMLGLPGVQYAHVPLIVAERDRRLSKRDRDAGVGELLERYGSPERVIGHIAALTGLIDHEEALSCDDLLGEFSLGGLDTLFPDKVQIPWKR